MTTECLKQTPLHGLHTAAGGRMAPFGGWDMPIQYPTGILREVAAVRRNAGMFDVSHMGRIEFSGSAATAFLDKLLSANVAKLRRGRSRYHVICNEAGGIIDDAIVYRLAETRYLLIVNAGNYDSVAAWLDLYSKGVPDLESEVTTGDVAMIAVQGPNAVELTGQLSDSPVASLRPFAIAEAEVAGIPCRIARTGYTGEDGFEIMPPADRAAHLWQTLSESGVAPCGLGARDVLRLEAGLLLHGNDMTVGNNPYEAGLERFVYLDSPGYVAADALRSIRDAGPAKRLTGFRMTGRGIARHGHPILAAGARIGTVTSGTHSPTLDANIGMGYVDPEHAAPSNPVEIDIRGRIVAAETVPLPFYRRTS
jgi:aminomethyltransferase